MEPRMLPPGMRLPKRYIAFELISEHPVKYGDFVAAFWESVLTFLGESEASRAGIWLIQNLYNEEKQIGMIKCRNTAVEHVRVALSLIQVVGESRVVVRIRGVTGTIKSARQKYLGDTNAKTA